MSALLGQQQLVEPDPRRRLIVPRGQLAWWGVDLSVRRVSIAYAASDGRRGAHTASFADLKGGARLYAIWAETRRTAVTLLERWPAPGLVVVEQPGGKSINHPLEYVCGVVQAAIYDAVLQVRGHGVAVETSVPAHWKLVACGRGDIYKPDPKKGRPGPYGVLVWAQANGYDGDSWDEADAWGIAEAARREVALEER